TAAPLCRPIQGIARYNQPATGINSVSASQTMQDRKTRAVGVDREYSSIERTAAPMSGPVQGIVRQNQCPTRTNPAEVIAIETIQVGKTGAIGVYCEYG